jgi:ABC-type branched-subunit amino acid transport system ATPase component
MTDGPESSADRGLDVEGLAVRRGGRPILTDISFSVGRGEALAILGPNGSGRTALLEALAGRTAVAEGAIRWRGRPITTLGVAARVELGVLMVTGVGGVFPRLSVAENLLVGCRRFAWDDERVRHRVAASLDTFPALAGHMGQAAGSLSGGEQQMLALARALVAEPSLLLIDELSLGLAPAVVGQLAATITQLRDEGVTIVVVEGSPRAALRFATRGVWLDRGRVVSEGPIAEWRGPARR